MSWAGWASSRMSRVRPTLRCLRQDLNLPLPPQTMPLDELDHPVLAKANSQFAAEDTPHERIAEIDDQVLFKVKVQRWRGAVWTEPTLGWLVATGGREAGSPDDFYAALARAGRAARARHNSVGSTPVTSNTHTGYLLPQDADRARMHAESGVRLDRRLHDAVIGLVRASLRDGREHVAGLRTFTVGIQVRADHGHETYVAVRVTGSVPLNLVAAILDHIPGCDPQGWFPEVRGLPDRPLQLGEVAWSNIMDPSAAAKILDADHR